MCVAIPGRVIAIIEGDGLERRARVERGGVVSEVSIGLVPDTRVGDHLVTHAGYALRVVAPADTDLVGSRRRHRPT